MPFSKIYYENEVIVVNKICFKIERFINILYYFHLEKIRITNKNERGNKNRKNYCEQYKFSPILF